MKDKKSEVADWQLREILKGIEDLDAGRVLPHEEVLRMLGYLNQSG